MRSATVMQKQTLKITIHVLYWYLHLPFNSVNKGLTKCTSKKFPVYRSCHGKLHGNFPVSTAVEDQVARKLPLGKGSPKVEISVW